MASFGSLDAMLVSRESNFTNPNSDPNVGSSRGNASSDSSQLIGGLVGTSTSESALLSTLCPALVIACFWFGLFIVCRRSQPRWYAPRTHLPNFHDHERTPELPNGYLNWLGKFFAIADSHVLHHSSLDGYLFLRFLRILCTICLVGVFFLWPILLPIHATGGGGNSQLDALSFSNVKNTTKYYAHAVLGCIYFGYVFYVIARESLFYANLRQAHLNSPAQIDRISSRTVLFMSVPEAYKDEAKLRKVFGENIQRVWITSDCSKLEKQVRQRDSLSFKLEMAETEYIRRANAVRMKAIKKKKAMSDSGVEVCEDMDHLWFRQVKRPMHRVTFFGQKVDSIDYYRSRLAMNIREVEDLQQSHLDGKSKPLSAVFIEFQSQQDAQIALQTLSHHQPWHMTPRFIGILPEEIIWSALNLSWWQRIVRRFAVQGGIAALVIFWSFPAAFVGSISNITYLTGVLPFLHFIDDLPQVILGVISGLLPTAALVLLMSLVPIICRYCARKSGVPSTARVELFTQTAVFCFQVVQVFLVTTLTSAASAATGQIIHNPLSAKDILAQNLPKASNFYVSYFLLQGLSISSITVIQVVNALIHKVVVIFFAGGTPRRLYNRWARLSGLSWGSVFPVFANMGVIVLSYSCIAPLILGFAFVGLTLIYHAYRYNFLFVYYLDIDTKGLCYARALQHLLLGIYMAEICLIGLFSVRAAIGPLIIVIFFFILSALAHISLNDALTPLTNYLPRNLDTEEETLQSKEETERLDRTEPRSRIQRLWKWIHPDLYRDYAHLRRKVRREPVPFQHSEKELAEAYFEPCIISATRNLWIPQDPGGLSKLEIQQTPSIIPISDTGAYLNEKNKIRWDKRNEDLPVWEKNPLY